MKFISVISNTYSLFMYHSSGTIEKECDLELHGNNSEPLAFHLWPVWTCKSYFFISICK